MGVVNLLEAVRVCPSVRVVVNVTSDKCYENRETSHAYGEADALGGHDPYSASKGGSELVTAAYRRSFFGPGSTLCLATARAGNVIGGGDWAADRLVPDCVRALAAGCEIVVRRPSAVRPWQHVLESLSGYLWLGARLLGDGHRYDGAWNFGPAAAAVSVAEVVGEFIAAYGSGSWRAAEQGGDPAGELHEAGLLALDCTKSRDELGWTGVWDSTTAVRRTAAWYRTWAAGATDLRSALKADIDSYVDAARARGVPWTQALVGATDGSRR
jgi:CDP-glucose 4,6-dehydratase